jgi:hypothetical protein
VSRSREAATTKPPTVAELLAAQEWREQGAHTPALRWLEGTPMDPKAVSPDPLPTVPGFPYAHRAAGVVIVGPTGGGRSSLVQVGCYDAARAGLRIAYLGSEVTEAEFNARAADLARRRGDTVDDALREQLARCRYLNLASVIARAWRDPSAWSREAAESFDVIVVDPLSSVASTLGLDFDKSSADFVRYYDALAQPVISLGLLLVHVDNVGHGPDSKTRAKGASAKSDRADLTFSCTLQRNPEALILTAQKVRTIRAPFQRGAKWVFDRAGQDVRLLDAAPGEQRSATFRPTSLMESASRTIEDHPGLSTSAIRRLVSGKATSVDFALELLVAEGYIRVDAEGQARRHHVERPYREVDDTNRVPLSEPSPNPVSDGAALTVSTPSRLIRTGDTGQGQPDAVTPSREIDPVEFRVLSGDDR